MKLLASPLCRSAAQTLSLTIQLPFLLQFSALCHAFAVVHRTIASYRCLHGRCFTNFALICSLRAASMARLPFPRLKSFLLISSFSTYRHNHARAATNSGNTYLFSACELRIYKLQC